ncbi:HAUS augmin-like complex subunit 7 isoform X1 [Erpetoichthys calabaricus]|uniref:HAUS augmin-like complex subunit 7 n=1 Tax=Erpetoichthys calabaricus TaxID=27687 RepID=A0A8C4SB47_ERPCA|nr:HAUS augmin-like complex subunit 7 isoform X1 [Erpetoichthys calabaricus]
MAHSLKDKLVAENVYVSLQRLGCPLVEGLFLKETESMLELLCTPSNHRLEILMWICKRTSPPLEKKLFLLKDSPVDTHIKEITNFGHEMMLCSPDDVDLIKGCASPKRQLAFMGQLVSILESERFEDFSVSFGNEQLLKELFSNPHLPSLLSPVCNPWPAHITEIIKKKDSGSKQWRSLTRKCKEFSLEEVSSTLKKTTDALAKIQMECTHLTDDPNGITSSQFLPQALKLAICDLSQLMAAFSQVFASDFREYCNREPPEMSNSAVTFQFVYQQLDACTQDLQATAQVIEVSEVVCSAVDGHQQKKDFWENDQMTSLFSKIEELKKKYEEFLSVYQRCSE